MSKPINHGIRWNDKELKSVFIDIKNGLNFNDMADKYKRTSSAIKTKILDISYDLIYIYNIDINIVSNIVKISNEKILNHINFKLGCKHNSISINEEYSIDNNKLDNKIDDNNNELYNNNELDNNIKLDINNNELYNNNELDNNIKLDINNDLNATVRELDVILNDEQQNAFNEFINKKNVFITGPGGTGKSVVIKEIIKYCKKNNINFGVTAYTGSAALLIDGKTIHSFLGIGKGDKTAMHLCNLNVKMRIKLVEKLRELSVLIIDEISLIDNSLFELISNYLLLVRNNLEPFGNLQLVLSGDFCQLEPIRGKYCFLSELWSELNLKIIFLHKMIRQQNDNNFQKILRSLRYGICSDKTLNILKNCNISLNNKDIIPTILYSKNINVDKINKNEYDKLILTNKYTTFDIKLPDIQKKNKEKILNWINSLDIPLSVDICINAQVIVTANINQDKGIVNGTRGIVTNFDQNTVTIRTINNNFIIINYFKTIDIDNSSMFFNYMPLKLAYALSIHKSQGTTLDAIEIDIGKDIFAAGQAYTALSRGKNLENIYIKDVSKESFIIKNSVLDFYSKIDPKLKY